MAASLILPDLRLLSRANKVWYESGIDSKEKCLDSAHFAGYPYVVEYRYNDRGFRDDPWPKDLKNAIWCVGDSFTVGIGQPFEHIWPQVLSRQSNRRTINISMDGASNNWIARRARDIMQQVEPLHLIVMWSYVERREVPNQIAVTQRWQQIYASVRDSGWPDCDSIDDIPNLPTEILMELETMHGIHLPVVVDDDLMISQDIMATNEENFANWQQCVDKLEPYPNIIHAVIPRFVKNATLSDDYIGYLRNHSRRCIQAFDYLDRARDGHHFDLETVKHFLPDILALAD